MYHTNKICRFVSQCCGDGGTHAGSRQSDNFQIGKQMVNRFMRTALLAAGISAMLTGCSGMKVWPFGGDKTDELTGQPKNSTEYQCEGGKKFYVRMLDHGKTAWVILPLREVALPSVVSASGARYSNGITTLDTKGNEATLQDGPDNSYKACKAAVKTEK